MSTLGGQISRASIWLLVSSLALSVLLALGAGWFAVPLNDDLARSFRGHHDGWLAFTGFMYRNWFGRWLGAAVEAGVLSTVDPYRYYPLLLLFLAALQFLALRVLMRELLLSKRAAWVGAAAALGLLWAATPHAGEYWYWFTGAAEYSMSVSLAILVVSAGLRGSGWSTGLAACGSIVVSGLHELSGIATLLALACGAFLTTGRERLRWVFLCAACVLGIAINVAAPGNSVRPLAENIHRSISPTVHAIAWDVLHELLHWMLDLKLWLALSLAFLWLASPSGIAVRTVPARLRLLAPAVTATAVAGWITAPAVMAGWRLNECSSSACFETLFVGCIVTLAAWTPTIRGCALMAKLSTDRSLSICSALLAVSLISTGNASSVARAIPGIYAWSSAQKARHALAIAAVTSGESQVVLPRIPAAPPIYMRADVGPDPKDWRNDAFAKMHGLGSVRVGMVETAK